MTTTPNPTWYDILGVARDATPEQIKAAWRAATDKFEPGSGTSQFRLFNEAADVLLDPARREAYDAELDGAPVGAPATDGPAEPVVAEPEPDTEAAAEPEAEPESEAEPEAAAEAVPGTEPDAGLETSTPATGPLARLGRLSDVVVAVIAALAVAAVVLAVFLAIRLQHRVDDYEAGPDAAAAAERALEPVFSFDYRHMEADRDRALQYLAPAYRKEYRKTFDDLLVAGPDGGPGPAVKTKAVVTADVVDTGIVDADRDRVRVVAFMNQTSVKGDASPTYLQNRLVATLVRDGNRWLIEDVKSY